MKKIHRIQPLLGTALLSAFLFTSCGDKSSDANAEKNDSNSSSSNSSKPAKSSPPALVESEHPLKEIKITGNDQMKFNQDKLEALPGQPLKVTFENVGSMPKASMGHNWALLKKGVDVMAFTEAGFASAGNDYINPDNEKDVIVRTAILGPGESETVTFNAPSEPGEYSYVCTFPGHTAAGMKGVLTVK